MFINCAKVAEKFFRFCFSLSNIYYVLYEKNGHHFNITFFSMLFNGCKLEVYRNYAQISVSSM